MLEYTCCYYDLDSNLVLVPQIFLTNDRYLIAQIALLNPDTSILPI